MRFRIVPISALLLGACSTGVEDRVTVLEFASDDALPHVNLLAVTALEPFRRDPESDTIQLVECGDIGTFPPVRSVNPDAIAVSNLVGRVLSDRESSNYPIPETWNLSFTGPAEDSPNNPFGAMMVYIEARGDARGAERGAGQVAATLLSGCYCTRTRDDGFTDPALEDLNRRVRKECPLLGGDDANEDRVVKLEPVLPVEFSVEPCEGISDLTAPRNAIITPGPQICIDTVRCDDISEPRACFRCEQPCDELEDKSNAPILFEVLQAGGGTSPASQVVLTDEDGRASATIEVDDCSAPISIRAQAVGRPEASVTFEVACVSPIAGFECTSESPLAEGFEAVGISTVPGRSTACATDPNACDHVAVLYENGTDARVEIRHPARSGAVDFVEYTGMRAYAVHGFEYEPGVSAVAVVLGKSNLDADVFVYRWQDGQLVPNDGSEASLSGFCDWAETCHSNTSCNDNDDCTLGDERCDAGACRIAGRCWLRPQLLSNVTIKSRDLDGDGKQDLVIGSNGELPMGFFWSSSAADGALFAVDGCSCGRFGQAPNAFALANMGGPPPNQSGVTDIVLGSAGGSFLKYAQSTEAGPSLTCGQSAPLGDGMSVRDVRRASLSCPPGQTCQSYDDAVIVSARGISGGSLDEPGFIRVLYGSDQDLSLGSDVLDTPGISLGLVPVAFEDRDEPRDPRSARIADFNADGNQDLAVLYKASEEVHVWLGASNRAFGEVAQGVVLEDCEQSIEPTSRCAPLPAFASPDYDGDGRAEITVICDPMGAEPRMRHFRTRNN